MSEAPNPAAELEAKLDAADSPDTTDQPENEATPDEAAGTTSQDQNEEFFDLDLTSVPEDADREWLAKRHKEMQAAFTKKTTSLAEQRREAEKITEAFNDPDTLAHLLRERGYDFEDETEDEDFDFGEQDQDFRSTPEWQQFQQFQHELGQAAQAEQEEQHFRSSVEELETREGREIDDTEWELLWSLSQAGVPVDDGYERISSLQKRERKALVKAKKDAPQVPKHGQSATQLPDLSTPRARADYVAEQLDRNG